MMKNAEEKRQTGTKEPQTGTKSGLQVSCFLKHANFRGAKTRFLANKVFACVTPATRKFKWRPQKTASAIVSVSTMWGRY